MLIMISGKLTLLLTTLLAATAVQATDDCATLPPPRDGNVQQAFSESDQLLAIYTCDKGFALKGNTILTCDDNGKWDKIPPLCVSLEECTVDNTTKFMPDSNKCPKLSSPQNGRMDNDLVNKGTMETATFNCFKGYYLVGAPAIFCEEGYWSGHTPQCNPVDCGKPEAPVNGTVEFEDTHYKSVAQYKCGGCHVLKGYNKRSCKPSGLWSKFVPKCEPVLDTPMCSLLDLELPEGAVTSSESPLSLNCGETIEIQCNQSLELEGADTATCNMDGSFTWNGLTPSCNNNNEPDLEEE